MANANFKKMDYLNGEYPDIYVPRELLRQVIKDDLNDQGSQHLALHGNCMDLFDNSLMYSGGIGMNELCMGCFYLAFSCVKI